MNENTIKWVKAAGVRAVKTMAQTAIATIGEQLKAEPFQIMCHFILLISRLRPASLMRYGADSGIRTRDLSLTKRLLFR